ncbi:septum formation family protein [Nocardioides hwasunensis]|uniref:Septum formation family protein n=1 Tax=Nocardioides hwasunensis TaxID=397258 RepID=A0ABR8MJF2_9ACTN|nr:septum formation family protein [Nocardioides hwasunensis]MBD3916148.1 septum formation family protein [Nocardioides hwasunensis]
MTALLRSAAAACALLVTLTACTASPSPEPGDEPSPSSTPTVTVPPDPGPTPAVGECHDLTFGQALAVVGRTSSVACRKDHTAQTYFVGRLDLTTKSGSTRRVDSQAAQRQMRRACTRRLPRHLARTPLQMRLNMAQAVWFTPTPEHAADGADWFRCDVVVVAAPRTLLLLPRWTKNWGEAPAIAMCATAAPGTRAFKRVTCGSKHTWRATTTVDIPGERLPKAAAIAERMDPACRDAARSQADDPLEFTWSQESPTAEQWDAGQRYGICWVPA